MKSWRTTAAGLAGALAVIFGEVRDLLDNDPATVFESSMVVGAVLMALALFKARDDKVTSEEAGAK